MASVIISAVLQRLGQIAGTAVHAVGRLPQNRPFELSDDGEYLFDGDERYDFVGFGEDGRCIIDSGELVSPGRILGYVIGGEGLHVRQLSTDKGTYVMVKGGADGSEIYRLCE